MAANSPQSPSGALDVPVHPRPTIVASEHLARNVESVASLHARAEDGLDHHQRRVERFTASIGRPSALYVICLLVGGWALFNGLAPRFGVVPPDPAPFFWMQGLVALLALLVTTMVLTTQTRIAKVVEKRAHLELQVNILAEQKVAKLIQLLEELRRDLPNVPNRVDPIANAMARSMDPGEVLEAIEGTIGEGDEVP